MNPLKKLVSQTAVYGLSSIVGRLLGYLLVPIYTRVLVQASQYGEVIELYSYIAVILIMLTYGMETAFFRFAESTGKKNKVFSTAFISILASSVAFIFLALVFKQNLADLIQYSAKPEYIVYLAFILFFDSINAIPYANLRLHDKAKRFVAIRLTGIFSNIGLNLILILFIPFLIKNHSDNSFVIWIQNYYNPNAKVDYIFISNVISSGLQSLMFMPEWLKMRFDFDFHIWKKMLVYAMPLLIFGLAGAVNEVIDRVLLKYLLPENIAMTQVGIYGAVYKVSIIMTIFIQAYRYAAEPFFFAQEKHKDAKVMYANMMKYFVMVTSVIFLSTMLYIDVVIYFVGENYRSGAPVIPILLMANLFLGIYYNLSVWYKLTDKTKYGAYISIFGAFITLTLNFYWIPRIGYTGSAWATFICYGSMVLLSYLIGRKYYPIPYDLKRIFSYLGLAVILYFMSLQIDIESLIIRLSINTVIIIGYIAVLYYAEKGNFRKVNKL
ncbi:MAG: polysaccharide biosynthesis C-terminal domain-containing protein [Bacteroidales bacterium]|nr:polysaccharide biosynthesis C-terminal domain-containing protein [Bacteroidales bacterium]